MSKRQHGVGGGAGGLGKVLRSIRGLAMLANRTKEARDIMEGVESVIQFNLEGERPFHVIIKDGKMNVREGVSEEPYATLTGEAEIFYKMITGEIDQDEAFSKKMYGLSGSIVDASRFRRIGQVVLEKNRRLIRLYLALSRLTS